jgi:hypothetical protein
MSVWFRGDIVGGQCGIGKLEAFRLETAERGKEFYKNAGYFQTNQVKDTRGSFSKSKYHYGGTGFFGSGFIDTPECRQAFDELCAEYGLVFQTPVRLNENSGKHFFYAMFDDKANEDITYINGKWPF